MMKPHVIYNTYSHTKMYIFFQISCFLLGGMPMVKFNMKK